MSRPKHIRRTPAEIDAANLAWLASLNGPFLECFKGGPWTRLVKAGRVVPTGEQYDGQPLFRVADNGGE